jgi:hypothetical protein
MTSFLGLADPFAIIVRRQRGDVNHFQQFAIAKARRGFRYKRRSTMSRSRH